MPERSGGWPASTLTRRSFLLAVASLGVFRVARAGPALVPAASGAGTPYVVETRLFHGALTLAVRGLIGETIDREAGRYQVRIVGEASGLANRIDGEGRLVDGRWTPVRTTSAYQVYGREARLEVAYDHERRRIEYRSRSETFIRRRLRVVEDLLAIPEGVRVDDGISMALNHAAALWPPRADGAFETHVVRRQRRPGEGLESSGAHRAELLPFVLSVTPAGSGDRGAGGKSIGLFDLGRFSSWARDGQPCRIVFGADRRPEAVTLALALGTSVSIRIGGGLTSEVQAAPLSLLLP